jgi:phosphatidylserine decarboxylase
MTSVRHIYVINTGNPNLGKVAIIEVGMAEVSGVIDKLEGRVGTKIHKGELMGMFQFGGSSHVFVFERKAAQAGLHFIK